jgi:hypothetical protein
LAETPGLDSGFRRRDDFEVASFSSFRRKPESSSIKKELDVNTIMALLIILAKDLGYGDSLGLIAHLEEVSKILHTYSSTILNSDS